MPRLPSSSSSRRVAALVSSSFALLAACGHGVDNFVATDEPLLAADATFHAGRLPKAKDADSAGKGELFDVAISGTPRQGAAGLTIGGTTNLDAYSVGFRLLGLGSGYWVVPVADVDPLLPDERNWSSELELGYKLPTGSHTLAVVVFDKHGKPSQQHETSVCVNSDLPDNGNACSPKKQPPAAIAALRWNLDADLDLSALSPDRVRYDRNHFSDVVDGKTVASLTADSAAACEADGRHTETFVWNEEPEKGTWYLYANLFDACGQTAVPYELTIYRRHDNGDGTWALREESSFAGEFLKLQTQTASANPLYLTFVDFP
jgi:hypothetical protein